MSGKQSVPLSFSAIYNVEFGKKLFRNDHDILILPVLPGCFNGSEFFSRGILDNVVIFDSGRVSKF